MAFSSALCHELPPINSTLQRFDARFFSLDFPLTAIATIVADSPDELHLKAEFRSNRDLVGLLWLTKDRYGHPVLSYEDDRDYSGCKLAFVVNPPDPYNFTVTLNYGGEAPGVYRMFPYMVSGANVVPNVGDAEVNGVGPGTSYPISTLFPGGLTVPAGHHVFVLDFDDLRLGFNYEQAAVSPTGITQLFFSITPDEYGLGKNAEIANVGVMYGLADNQVRIGSVEDVYEYVITGVNPNLRFAKGDIIQAVVSHPDQPIVGKKSVAYTLKNATLNILVNQWSGEGTTERRIRVENEEHVLKGVTWGGGKASAVRLQRDTPLGSIPVNMDFTNISVTGPGAVIGRRFYPQATHLMEMTTGYDDTYNITPWRQLDNTYNLGYRGFFTIYMGMSHYFKANATGGYQSFDNKVVKDAAQPLNVPTQQWWASMCALGHPLGYNFIWSTSYEILNSYCPDEWAQKDYLQRNGLSGWSPPSAFVIPAMRTADGPIDYLARTIKHGLSIATANGAGTLRFQIGEPWWWDGSYTNGAPAIYDPYTRSKYTSVTGQPVPEPWIQNYRQPGVVDPGSPYLPYLEWLGTELGESTNYIRDSVKAAYPAALATLLFFSPQIFAGVQTTAGLPLPVIDPSDNGMLSIINFPIAEWEYPNYDFMQIEDYDWIIRGELEKLPLTRHAAVNVLGYPLSVVQYFVGFVLFAKETWVWPSINIATRDAKKAGVSHIAVWAYPQVVRDGILYDDSLLETQVAAYPTLPARRGLLGGVDAAVLRPVFFCQIGDDIFMTSADRNIEHSGHTWTAVSRFGKITPLGEGMAMADSGWNMRLDAIPLNMINDVVAGLKLDKVTLSVGLAGPDNQLVELPKSIGGGKVFSNNVEVNEKFASVVVSVRSGLATWAKNNGSRYTHEAQQLKHPDDNGLSFISLLTQRRVLWGPRNAQ